MNKKYLIVIVLGSLSFLGIAWFTMQEKSKGQSKQVMSDERPNHEDTKGNQKLLQVSNADRKAANEKLLAQIAQQMTPEIRSEMVKTTMQIRSQKYKMLFKNWGLDEQTSNEILRLIEQNKIEMTEAAYRRYALGASNAQNFAADRLTETELLNRQIINIVGEEKFKEFVKAEQSFESNSQAQLNARLND